MRTTFLTFLFSIILSSCTWMESIKPKEPFYCKVNGETFRPDKDSSPVGGIGSDPLKVTFDKSRGVLTIYSRNNPRFVGLKLVFPNSEVSKGTINLSSNLLSNVGIFTPDRNSTSPDDLYSDSGIVEITKVDGYSISGTFQFTCKSIKTGKEYKITDGEFNNISYY